MCINHGKWDQRLGEINISNVHTDGHLFRKIRETYEEIRGFRAKNLYLLEPVNIHFVKVRRPCTFPTKQAKEIVVQPGGTMSAEYPRETGQLAFRGRDSTQDLVVRYA